MIEQKKMYRFEYEFHVELTGEIRMDSCFDTDPEGKEAKAELEKHFNLISFRQVNIGDDGWGIEEAGPMPDDKLDNSDKEAGSQSLIIIP